MRRRERGFTLIELLVTVAIIGLVAAMALMNFLAAITRARQKTTMNDIRQIATAWEARATDLQTFDVAGAGFTFPGTAVDPTALADALEPTYIRHLPRYDGWKRPFAYGISGVGQTQTYAIRSMGRDGIWESAYTEGVTSSPDCDIVYAEGRFVAYPEGAQSK